MKSTQLGEFEELVLLIIGALGDDAYSISIKNEFKTKTGRNPSIGALHSAFNRLEKKGFLESEFGEATAIRGGKRKRFYKVTPYGKKALESVMETRKKLWEAIPNVAFDFKFA